MAPATYLLTWMQCEEPQLAQSIFNLRIGTRTARDSENSQAMIDYSWRSSLLPAMAIKLFRIKKITPTNT